MNSLSIPPPLSSLYRSPPYHSTVKSYLYRPLVEISKIAVAALYGAVHGATQANHVICNFGAPEGAISALIAIAIRSGQANAPLSNIYKSYFQNPITQYASNGFLKPDSLTQLTNTLDLVNLWFINSSPLEYFYSGLLGTLVHEAFSFHPLAAKQGILASQHVEDFAFKFGLIEKKERFSTTHAETAARVSAWFSSLVTVTLLIEILHYGLDSNYYLKYTFSEHVNTNIISPIQEIFTSIKKYF